MSPSVWWNAGEFSELLKVNYEQTSMLPTSIVLTVGSQEAYSWMGLGPDIVTTWDSIIQSVADSFASIGLGSGPASPSQVHPDGSYHASLQSNLVYVLYEGGMHNMVNQVDLISYAVPLAYSYDYPSQNGAKVQRNSLMTVRYPVPSSSSESSEDESDESVIVGLSVAFALVSLLCVALGVYVVVLTNRFASLKTQSSTGNLL
jgi:hypothetical protein